MSSKTLLVLSLSLVAVLFNVAPSPTSAAEPSVHPAGPAELPMPTIETLPNGLQIVWYLDNKLPVVDMMMLVKSGYRDDPAGKSGTAELLAASLDRGAGGMNTQTLARSIENLGASRSFSAEEDSFTLSMHGLAPDGLMLLELLSKVALHPDLSEVEVNRQHDRIVDRWSHTSDFPEALATLAFQRIAAAGTPYGRGNFKSVAEFKNVGRADIQAFYKTHFTPKNAILMIVGRAKQDDFRKRIGEVFGAWQGEAPVKTKAVYTDTRLQAKPGDIVIVNRPGLNEAQVRMGFKGPDLKAPEHYSLVVANALFGEYFNSKLNSVIRDKLSLTYSISSTFFYSKDLGRFAISSSTRNESVGQLIQKTREILAETRDGFISNEEVTTAKEYLIGGYPLTIANISSIASRWLNGWFFDLGPNYLNEFVPKISAVSRQDVVTAAQKDFDLPGLYTVVAGNASEIEKSLSPDQRKRVKRVAASDLM